MPRAGLNGGAAWLVWEVADIARSEPARLDKQGREGAEESWQAEQVVMFRDRRNV